MLDWILVAASLALAVYIIVSRVRRGGAAGLSGGCDNCSGKEGCPMAGKKTEEDCRNSRLL